jgi:hypothetical protein
MITNCPICGRALSDVEIVVSEHDMSFQCHHCWNRIRLAEHEPSHGELVGTTRGDHGSKQHAARRSTHGHGRKQ